MSSLFRFASPICLMLIYGSGCGQLWGTYSEPDPENCVRDPNVCKGGEHCNMDTQACEPTDLTPIDPFPPPAAPTTFISPGGLASTLTFPRDVQYTLAAAKPAKIYYTIDGTTPTTSGMDSTLSGQSPVFLNPLPNGTMLRWFGDYGAGFNPETPRSFTAATDSTVPTTPGSISEIALFATVTDKSVLYNLGPVVIVSRGARMSMRVNFQAWAAAGGSSRLQYVISGDQLGTVGCLDNIQTYGAYPGQSLTVFITFNAPFFPGHYPLVAGLTSSTSCDLTTSATGPEIAQIFVE